MSSQNPMPRLFIAAWPDSMVRGQLAEYSAKCEWAGHAKPVAVADIHLTLRFIGDVDLPLLSPLRESLALDFDAFDLELERPQLWKEVAVLWPSATSAALTELHDAIDDRLQGLGFTADSRSFRPHVTLARHAKHSRMPQPTAIAWHINAFCLVESTPSSDGRYHILQTYLAR
ncbi:MAG TPA: RNA 2',3'-cyclic phosphodiesterase [Polaromonas sp.]